MRILRRSRLCCSRISRRTPILPPVTSAVQAACSSSPPPHCHPASIMPSLLRRMRKLTSLPISSTPRSRCEDGRKDSDGPTPAPDSCRDRGDASPTADSEKVDEKGDAEGGENSSVTSQVAPGNSVPESGMSWKGDGAAEASCACQLTACCDALLSETVCCDDSDMKVLAMRTAEAESCSRPVRSSPSPHTGCENSAAASSVSARVTSSCSCASSLPERCG